EGNSLEPLPDHLHKEWQREAARMRMTFCELVAKGRGNRFNFEQAMKTESAAFSGAAAVKLGLADQVADPKRAFDAMVEAVNQTGRWDGTIPATGAKKMSSSGCTTGADAPTQEEAMM